MLAHVLGFDGAIGSRSEIVDGVYTGRAGGPFTYREGKAEAMRELAAREGIDLAASYAYSDSESDLPMLRAVGHPVAVNPDAALRASPRRRAGRSCASSTLGRRLKAGARRRARWPLGRRAARAWSSPGRRSDEPARADRRAARDPRARAALRRRGDRAAGAGVGPRAPLPEGASSRSSASSG